MQIAFDRNNERSSIEVKGGLVSPSNRKRLTDILYEQLDPKMKERVKASLRSQTQASPPGCEAISDISRSRTGSASAFNIGATWAACSADSGSRDSGGQQAAVSTGSSTSRDFDIHLY